MPRPSKAHYTWEKIKKDYEDGKPIAELAEQYSVSKGAIYGRVHRYEWKRRDAVREEVVNGLAAEIRRELVTDIKTDIKKKILDSHEKILAKARGTIAIHIEGLQRRAVATTLADIQNGVLEPRINPKELYWHKVVIETFEKIANMERTHFRLDEKAEESENSIDTFIKAVDDGVRESFIADKGKEEKLQKLIALETHE